MKIISVHAPKAGGTSVSRALASAFAHEFLTDYAEDPADPRSPRNIDPDSYFSRRRVLPDGVRCLHGHFHPGQFDLSDDVFLFTLLRHPLDNIISIYFFWKTLSSQGQPLHDYFSSRQLDILDMARLPLLRYLYSRTYFGSFDMSRFNLIGCHEDRDSALHQLSRAAGVTIDTSVHVNATSENIEREKLLGDRVRMRTLHCILKDDIRFYEQVCS